MDKAQHLRMQGLTLQLKGTTAGSIDIISQDRVPDTRHMHTNLVGASGLQLAFHQGIISETLQNMIVRDRFTTVPMVNGLLLPVLFAAADGGIYGAAFFLDVAADNGGIFSGDGMHLQLLRQGLVRFVIFADHQKAGGIHIDAMHNAGALYAVDGGQICTAVMHNGIHKRAALMTVCRMHHHALRFIHDQKIIVLVYNIQRNVFRRNIQCFRRRNAQTDPIPGP